MLEKTRLYQELQKRKSKYKEKVDEIYQYASDVLPKINRVFANYTGHGIEHSINVMQYMYDLVTDISAMSDLEITCLIYAALLHDVGMVADEKEIEDIKNDELNYYERKYSVIYEKYQNENLALQECIRPMHGERARHHIMKMKKDFFILPEFTNCNFQEEAAKICQAHTMSREWLLQNLDKIQVKGEDTLNAQYVAMLLRIADYLDIDEKRASIDLYRLLSPTGFGDEEWRLHYIIENKEKIVKDDASGSRAVVIYGQCDDAKIHRKFLQYLSGLSEEFLWCTSYTRKYFERKYWILLQPQIDNRIQTKGFEISDLKMQMDYHAVVKLLMGENLYGDEKYGLRELVQNAVDACRIMVEEAELLERYRYVPYMPKIQVILDFITQKMIVMDNGIGMKYDVLMKYFLNIGKSYYKSDEFLYQGKNYCPIGTFGIGFLACFMLSDSVIVETKHYTDYEGFTIELERDSEFVCKKRQASLITDSGTAIILDLKSILRIFGRNTADCIKEYLESTFLNQGVDMQFIVIDDVKKEETLNLKELEELIPDGIRLDSFLNGISACIKMKSENIEVSKKLSDLCTYLYKGEIEFAEYDYIANKLCIGDLEGNKLKKYINNGCLMVFKVQGIMKEKKLYEDWKLLDTEIDDLPDELLRTIFFPIEYDASLLQYCENHKSSYDGHGGIWYPITWYKWEEDILKKWDIEKILFDGKLLTERFRIGLGIFHLIEVGNERYIGYDDDILKFFLNDNNKTYWHGIKLDKGRIPVTTYIAGIECGICAIDILRNDITPNVARDDLVNDESEKIKLAVERAVYQYIINKVYDDAELQAALQDYVDENYPADNPYYAKT